jgi:small conductance mechanosensitive channel
MNIQESGAPSGTLLPGTAGERIDSAADGVAVVIARIQDWLADLVALLPNIMAAVLVLLLFFALSRIARKLMIRGLSRTALADTIVRLLARIASFAVLAIGLFFALGLLHLDKTVTSLLAGAGVIGLALAFAFQDLAANFMAGIYMSLNRPFEIGHLVETNGVLATVQEIDMRATILRTAQGQIVRIPNKQVFESKLINYSLSGERRVDLEIGVSYGEDLEQVRKVAIAAVKELEVCDPARDPDLIYTGFGDSSINLTVRFWVNFKGKGDYLTARDAAIVAIKKAFDTAEIVIPFPIRTLDFAIKGGGRLRTELQSSDR